MQKNHPARNSNLGLRNMINSKERLRRSRTVPLSSSFLFPAGTHHGQIQLAARGLRSTVTDSVSPENSRIEVNLKWK
jgi:hypothetical protein